MLAQFIPADPNVLKTALLVFFLFTVLAIGVAIISRYREQINEPDDRPEDLLEAMKDAFIDGELDEAEFRRIQDVLARKADGDIAAADISQLPPERPAS